VTLDEERMLIERAKSDPVQFAALYDLYVDRIYNYLFQRTGNHADAEDLTARVFLRALTHVRSYTYRGVPLSAWLYRIAHNAVVNWYRDRRRHQVVALDAAVWTRESSAGPELLTQAQEQERRLLEVIRGLPADRQHLLVLKFSEGLSNSQIAEVMDRSEGAIKSLYHRTLLSLRHELERG